jgi:hypothetical protein
MFEEYEVETERMAEQGFAPTTRATAAKDLFHEES